MWRLTTHNTGDILKNIFSLWTILKIILLGVILGGLTHLILRYSFGNTDAYAHLIAHKIRDTFVEVSIVILLIAPFVLSILTTLRQEQLCFLPLLMCKRGFAILLGTLAWLPIDVILTSNLGFSIGKHLTFGGYPGHILTEFIWGAIVAFLANKLFAKIDGTPIPSPSYGIGYIRYHLTKKTKTLDQKVQEDEREPADLPELQTLPPIRNPHNV